MKCNTDFKFIGTGEDAKAFMYYVTDYITKAPLSMYAGLAALSYAIRSYEAVNWAEILAFVGAVMEGNKDNTQTGAKKPTLSILDWTSLKLSVTNDRGRVSASNLIMDYIYRPASDPFSSMSLYKFIAWTIKIPNSDVNKLRNKGAEFSSSVHPQYSTHKMKIRQKLAIPVLLGPNIKRKSASEEEHELWAKEMVILFRPWRDPISLKDGAETWAQAMIEVQGGMDEWEVQVVKNMTLLPDAKHAKESRSHYRSAVGSKHPPSTMQIEQGEDEEHHTRIQEANVYKTAWEHVEGECAQTESQGELSLETLINKDAADIFALCYGEKYRNCEGSDDLETEESDVDDYDRFTEDDEATKMQKAYMEACRHGMGHTNEDTKKEEDIDLGEKTERAGVESKRKPDVTIDVVHRIKLKIEKEGGKSPWQIVNMLLEERGIHDNPEQLKALCIIAHHVIEGGDQLLINAPRATEDEGNHQTRSIHGNSSLSHRWTDSTQPLSTKPIQKVVGNKEVN
ncbi:hypothetical protein MD484_g4740, partial [Candolleomyces efflorescens]